MTDIAFHFNVGEPLAYACRLLRKAYGAGAHVTVVGPEAALADLDRALWTFTALDFVPHCRSNAPATVRERTSIVLAPDAAAAQGHADVLLNLGDGVPSGFEQFERLIELVSTGDADRQQARARWRHYAERGYSITRHDLAARGS